MLHTLLRRRADGESIEQIQPDLISPLAKRKGQNPSVASVCRVLAEHARLEAYPETVEQAHAASPPSSRAGFPAPATPETATAWITDDAVPKAGGTTGRQGHRQRARVRRPPALPGPARDVLHHLPQHQRVTLSGEQPHRQREVHHQRRRQRPRLLLPRPRLLDHQVHQLGREGTREQPQPHPIRVAPTSNMITRHETETLPDQDHLIERRTTLGQGLGERPTAQEVGENPHGGAQPLCFLTVLAG